MRIATALVLTAVLSAAGAAQPLAGGYSINPLYPTGAGNFATLLDAVNALVANGVSGAVTFDIFDDAGPYNEAHPFTTANTGGGWAPSTAVLCLAQWAGASAANRVTFRAAAGESPVFDATGRAMGVFWNGADYVTIEGIEIRNAPYDGVSLYSESSHGQVFDAIIRRCRIHDCGASGVCIYGNSSRPQNTLVENNFFWNLQITNAGAFSTTARFGYVSGRRHDFSRLVNNTFHVSTAAGSGFCVVGDMVSGGVGSHFSEVSNNIIVKTVNAARPVYSFPDNPTGTNGVPAILDANCYFDTSGGPFSAGSVVAANFTLWQTASSRDASSIEADPLLVNPVAGDLHINPVSPCVDLSALPSGVVDDIDGEIRSGVPDIGADETGYDYQTNSPAATLTINGLNGTPSVPAVTTVAQGAPVLIQFSSTNVGFPFETIIAAAPLVPASGGGLLSPNGQILNVSPFAPVVIWLNGGATPALLPFPGGFAIGFNAPFVPATLSLQSIHMDGVHPDGYVLSQGCQLTIQ